MKAFERKGPIIAITAAAIVAITAPASVQGAVRKKPAVTAKTAPARSKTVPALKPSATPVAAPLPPLAKPIGKPGDWFPPESYPPDAKVAGQEGRTAFALDIDARGRITACHILTSSGSDLLDSTTCSQLIANGRFEPAHDANGKPVAGQWRSAMRWELQTGPASEPER